jgi:hypothetical protein
MRSHKSELFRDLKRGIYSPLYEILMRSPRSTSEDCKCLVQVKCFNVSMINLDVIAYEFYERNSNSPLIISLWRRYDDIIRLKQIDVMDLPLYLGWAWKSNDFTQILKGEIIVPCSRYIPKMRGSKG